MRTTIEKGKITKVELNNQTYKLKQPVPVSEADSVLDKLSWVEDNLVLKSESEPDPSGEPVKQEWTEDELASFITNRKKRGKTNQLLVLKALAEHGHLSKNEIDDYMNEHSPSDWSGHSFGGCIGGLSKLIDNKGKERPYKSYRNSDLNYGEYEIRSKYQDQLQELLGDWSPEEGDA